MTQRADFTETLQVKFTDEALDAVCLEDLVCTSALEDLCVEEICLNDHHVSLVIPVHRGEGVILHDPPKLPGKGQHEDGCFWVWALWRRAMLGTQNWALWLVPLLL